MRLDVEARGRQITIVERRAPWTRDIVWPLPAGGVSDWFSVLPAVCGCGAPPPAILNGLLIKLVKHACGFRVDYRLPDDG